VTDLHGAPERLSRPAREDAARIRDMPAPRRSGGLAGRVMRWIFRWPFKLVLAGAYRAGFRPLQLTFLSLAANVVIGWLLLSGRRLVPGILLVPAGLFDILDGAIARLRGEESRFGAFLDSFLDRVSDVILFGCLYWSLSAQHDRLAAGLALATLVISLSVSHIRAEAEDAGVSLSEGFFQRLERYIAMIIGLMVPGALVPALVALVVLGGVTVLQRGWAAVIRVGLGDDGA
jgi:CDP-diacylglycerol---glycerol-3-phosphate 3-phosphatidyltransferase